MPEGQTPCKGFRGYWQTYGKFASRMLEDVGSPLTNSSEGVGNVYPQKAHIFL
jgi:hypothetical protein